MNNFNLKIEKKIGDKYYFERDGSPFSRPFTKEEVSRIIQNTKSANKPMLERKRLIDEYEENLKIKEEKEGEYLIEKKYMILCFQILLKDFVKNQDVKHQLKSNTEEDKYCIYCKNNKLRSQKTREHIIQNAFVKNNIVLKDCVCRDCNDSFKLQEQDFSRKGIESYVRFDSAKIRSSENIFQNFCEINTKKIFKINRKTGELFDEDFNKIIYKDNLNQLYYNLPFICDTKRFRIIAKNIFNFIAGYIGYDEIIKKEWDNARNYIRYEKYYLKTNTYMIDNIDLNIFFNFLVLDFGVNLQIKNLDNNVVGVIRFFDTPYFTEFILVENYNIPNFTKISALFIPNKDPIFY